MEAWNRTKEICRKQWIGEEASTQAADEAADEAPPQEQAEEPDESDLTTESILADLEEFLIAERLEERDFERLREKLFRGHLKLGLPLPTSKKTELPPSFTDKVGTQYLHVKDNRRSHHAHHGFGGGFYIMANPVSQGAFFAFLEETDYHFPLDIVDFLKKESSDDAPMSYTTWSDARAYCRWITMKTHQFHDLPYEEEWKIAGEMLVNYWPQQKNHWYDKGPSNWDGAQWLPPGTEDFGGLLKGTLQAPGNSGLIWEWCDDKLEDDNTGAHLACSGIWPGASTNGIYSRSRVLNHVWPSGKRLGTTGFRLVALPRECLLVSHRGMAGVVHTSTAIDRYLADVVNDNTLPGSPRYPNDRPAFYDNLPGPVRERAEHVLSLVHKIEWLIRRRTPGHALNFDDDIDLTASTIIRRESVLSVAKVHRIVQAPTSPDDAEVDLNRTRMKIAKSLILDDKEEEKP